MKQSIKEGEGIDDDINSYLVSTGLFKYNEERRVVRDEAVPLITDPISALKKFKAEAREEKRIKRALRKEKQANKQNEYKLVEQSSKETKMLRENYFNSNSRGC